MQLNTYCKDKGNTTYYPMECDYSRVLATTHDLVQQFYVGLRYSILIYVCESVNCCIVQLSVKFKTLPHITRQKHQIVCHVYLIVITKQC